MWKMLCLLEEFFGIRATSVVQLTPPGATGFLPHYDDAHTFILQLEGTKQWKFYGTKDPNHFLSRESNPHIEQVDFLLFIFLFSTSISNFYSRVNLEKFFLKSNSNLVTYFTFLKAPLIVN